MPLFHALGIVNSLALYESEGDKVTFIDAYEKLGPL